jgi:VCBS repeat-containing protein
LLEGLEMINEIGNFPRALQIDDVEPANFLKLPFQSHCNAALAKRHASRQRTGSIGVGLLPISLLTACGSSLSQTGQVAAANDVVTVTSVPVAAVTGNVLINDSGTTGAIVSAVSASGVSGTVGAAIKGTLGSLVLNADGGFSYTLTDKAAFDALPAGQSADDSFSYTASTSRSSSTALLMLKLTGVNDAPVTVNDRLTLAANSFSGTVSLLVNDSDPDQGAKISVSRLGSTDVAASTTVQGTYGAFTVRPDGTLTYAIDKARAAYLSLRDGQSATETITYTAKDDQNATNTGTLTVDVVGINEGPQVPAQTITYDLRNGNAATLFNFAINGFDPEGDTGFKVVAINDNAAYFNAYPDYYFSGYYNPVPVVTGFYTVPKSYGTLSINGLYSGNNAIDVGGFIQFYVNVSDPGLIALKPGEVFEDHISYTLNDAGGGTSTSEIIIKIIGRDDAPVQSNPNIDLVPQGTYSVRGNLLTGLTDPEGSALSLKSVYAITSFANVPIQLNGGVITVQENGDFLFTLDTSSYYYQLAMPSSQSSVYFYFSVSDGVNEIGFGHDIAFFGVNDAPVAVNDGIFQLSADDASLPFGVTINDRDPDSGDNLTIIAINGISVSTASSVTTTNGLFKLVIDNSSGGYSFVNTSPDLTNPVVATLAYGQTLTDSYAYTIADTGGLTSTATVQLQLTGVYQSATAGDDIFYNTRLHDTFAGLGGNDQLVVPQDFYSVASFLDGDIFDGGAGIDTLNFSRANFSEGLTIDMNQTKPVSGYNPQTGTTGPFDLTILNVENVIGTGLKDIINGDAGDNRIDGGNGDDTVRGNQGNDILIGGYGTDILNGGSGNDLLIGEIIFAGAGNDILVASAVERYSFQGGTGADTFIINPTDTQNPYLVGNATITITDFSSADGDRIDVSHLRDPLGNFIDLSAIVSHATDIGDSISIDLSSFTTPVGTNLPRVGGTLILDGIANISDLHASDFIFSGGFDWRAASASLDGTPVIYG